MVFSSIIYFMLLQDVLLDVSATMVVSKVVFVKLKINIVTYYYHF